MYDAKHDNFGDLAKFMSSSWPRRARGELGSRASKASSSLAYALTAAALV